MSLLISEILQDSKSLHPITSIKLRRIHLSELMENLIPKYENWMQVNQIQFEYHIARNVYVLADELPIEQAIHNYMMNALKHTRQGKRICLSLSVNEKKAKIVVYNDGNGIAESDLGKIWEGYYQGENEDIHGDIGLGLYIVKDIVTQHKGICGVKNTRTGVEFWIELNLAGDE